MVAIPKDDELLLILLSQHLKWSEDVRKILAIDMEDKYNRDEIREISYKVSGLITEVLLVRKTIAPSSAAQFIMMWTLDYVHCSKSWSAFCDRNKDRKQETGRILSGS